MMYGGSIIRRRARYRPVGTWSLAADPPADEGAGDQEPAQDEEDQDADIPTGDERLEESRWTGRKELSSRSEDLGRIVRGRYPR